MVIWRRQTVHRVHTHLSPLFWVFYALGVILNKGMFEQQLLLKWFMFKQNSVWDVLGWSLKILKCRQMKRAEPHLCVSYFHSQTSSQRAASEAQKKTTISSTHSSICTSSHALLFMLIVLTSKPPFSLTAKSGSAHKTFLTGCIKQEQTNHLSHLASSRYKPEILHRSHSN